MKETKIEDYLPFIKSIIAPYRNAGVPYDDLVQEGMLGLWEAMQRYDPAHNTKLTTYAAYWIKKRILSAIQKERKENLDSTELNEEITPADKTDFSNLPEKLNLPEEMPDIERNVLTLSFEKQLTLKEIAKELNITREKARQIKAKGLRRLKAALLMKS